MKKKLLALAAVLALGMSLSGCGGTSSGGQAKPQESKSATEQKQPEKPSDPNVVGIKEIPVGDSGEQSNGPLNVNVVYFQAVDMEHGSMKMPPASESDMHFEIDASTNKKAEEFGYPADTFMPYLDDMKVTVKDQKTGEETDLGTMMPMIASDGPHYGNNIKLKPGLYDVTITIPSPEDKFMLHTGKDSSGVKGRFWKEPLKFEFKNWQWDGQVL